MGLADAPWCKLSHCQVQSAFLKASAETAKAVHPRCRQSQEGASASHVHAAVDMQGLASDVAGAGRCEEEHRVSDLLRSAQAAGRDALEQFRLPLLLQTIGHVRLDEAGREGVHSDGTAAHLAGQGPGEAVHAGLGGGVVGLPGVAHGADDGGDRDDAAPPRLGHVLEDSLGHAEDGVKVCVDDIIPIRVLHAQHERVLGDAGVVDQDVNLAVRCLDLVQDLLHVGRIDDVQLHALALEGASEARRNRLGAAVGRRRAHDRGAGLGEALRDGRADAPGGTGHEGDLAGEVEALRQRRVSAPRRARDAQRPAQ
mmetsp:Transcript_43625/g.113287  ORF Transcript_43625/g.113287 Transcript_43625/m.113287 type:complete len:312 (+) Transcript_43625:70-1005(+)